MPPKLNKEWHLQHKMPKNPSLEARIAWHLDHSRNCACRPMPEAIRVAIATEAKVKPGKR